MASSLGLGLDCVVQLVPDLSVESEWLCGGMVLVGACQVGLMWLLIMASLNITLYWELQISSIDSCRN